MNYNDQLDDDAVLLDCNKVNEGKEYIEEVSQCKVCWGQDNEEMNPLLNSCKCDGSVRFIHYECLKHWLK